MLNLPAPPRTRITRQLECVSCRHVFSISEDNAVRENGQNEPGDSQQLSAYHYPHTRLRYQPDRHRRPVTPESRAVPYVNENRLHDADEEFINCPRCGTDNRNWLHTLHPPIHIHAETFNDWLESKNISPRIWKTALTIVLALIAGSLAYLIFAEAATERLGPVLSVIAVLTILLLALLLVFVMRPRAIIKFWYWQQRFGTALIGLLLTAVFVILAVHFHYDSGPEKIGRSITLLVVIALAGIIPTFTMLGTWKRLREYKFLRAIVPTQSRLDFSPPVRAWVGYTIFFLFIIPFILYFLVPGAFHLAFSFTKQEVEEPAVPVTPTLEQRIETVRSELDPIFDNEPEEITKPIGEAINELLDLFEKVPLSTDTLDELPEKEKANFALMWTIDLLENASNETQESVAETITLLEKIINITKLPGEQQAKASKPVSDDTDKEWFTVGDAFLNTWFKYVLAVSIATLVFSLSAVNGYVRRINHNLPRPLFHSIAAMTRVVVWEAGAALEIGDEIDYMQWTDIRRNATGGIDLVGIYQDTPPSGQADESTQTRVRAQRYEISSDQWGHIQSAQITAVRVPIRLRLPRRDEEASISSEFFRSAVHVRDSK